MKDDLEDDDSGASTGSGCCPSVASISGASISGASTAGGYYSGASTPNTCPSGGFTPGASTSDASTVGPCTSDTCISRGDFLGPSTSGTNRPKCPQECVCKATTVARIPRSYSARASRNLAEKQRRDNLNANISTMASLVPAVANSPRRQDKISILRLTAAFLRANYTLGKATPGILPSKFKGADLEQLCLQSCDGNVFCIIMTTAGSIIHVSDTIESHLGYLPLELLGKSLFSYVYPEDHDELSRALVVNEDTLALVDGTISDQNPTLSSEEITAKRRNYRERRTFVVKIAQKTTSRGEHIQYKCFSISGVLKLAEHCIQRPANKEYARSSNDIIFVGLARGMHRRVTELSLLEATKEEYVTRHLVDGRIIFCDHRISIVAGYMSEEVSGANAFRYMHKDDVRWTIIGLRQMYDRREGFGSSCYRLLSKTGDFIYLRTHGYLEMDTKTGTFESFVCVNTLVDAAEGEKLIREMKNRYTATMNNASRVLIDPITVNSSSSSPPSVEDPTQLEGVILKLISDLSTPIPINGRISPGPAPDVQSAKAAMFATRLPPAAVQANHLGVKLIERPLKSKLKQIRRTMSAASSISSDSGYCEEPRHRSQTQISNRLNGSNRIPVSSIPKLDSPVVDDVLSNITRQELSPIIQQVSSQATMFYESHQMGTNSSMVNSNINNAASLIETTEGAQYGEMNSTLHYYGHPETMGLFMKGEAGTAGMNMAEEISGKRPFEVESEGSDKRQRQEYYSTEDEHLDNSTFQAILNSNSDIYKLLDEMSHPLNPDKDSSRADILHLVPEQKVDETLRQTYAHLQDSIDYQGTQINELGLAFENSELHTRRPHFHQLQAEHEIQKKMIKTLQKDHHSMQVNVKQNVGV
ncbi:circadian locomoter output cycles protein kaput-like isoform X2 [Diachasmimorpha longicaudata]|uniref:circadian locomoter output cycles protein kaput-like isoform X2 n=1 Tax=Diachasmimorpha longicaudata TaxID=58733 RepID=UPI0030B884FE